MARFSIVIPAHHGRADLRKCLDSVLQQPFQDIEVIVVGRSPAALHDTLEDRSRKDRRVRLLHPKKDIDPGRARNEGANAASGEYLLFLDGHDRHLPGSLAAISERLTETGEPDLLLFDHVRTHRNGTVASRIAKDPLSRTEHKTFTLRDRPEVARLPAIVYDKVFRTRFWWENEFTFHPGLYEDSPIAYQTMMTARSIAHLDRPCLNHRPPHDKADMVLPSRRHFDIFVQYAGVYAYVEQHPELDDLRDVVFPRMIDHFLSCLERTSRVRPSDRRVYFRRIKELYRRYRPNRVAYPPRLRGLEFRLVELGLYTPYAALKIAQSNRLGLRHASNSTTYELCHRLLRLVRTGGPGTSTGDPWNQVPGHESTGGRQKAHLPTPDLFPVHVLRPEETLRPAQDDHPSHWTPAPDSSMNSRSEAR